MMIFVFRCLYLVLVLIGLAVNINELRSAMTVYRMLIAAGINGSRQVLASHFVRKAVMLCGIQAFLAIPAAIGIIANMTALGGSPYAEPVMLIGVLAHMGAVLMLMLMAVMSWYDRSFSMDVLSTEVRASKNQELAEKADVASVLKGQLDAILEAVRALRQEQVK